MSLLLRRPSGIGLLRAPAGPAVAFVAVLAASPAAAQNVRVPPTVDAVVGDPFADAAVDELFFAGRLGEALQRLELRIERDSADAGALWRAARTALVAGVLESRAEVEEAWFRRAGRYGEAAVALRPDDPDVLYWAASSLGREALQHGPRTSTRLVQRTWDLTHRALELDPDHPGAHNILGKLNQEVMGLSGLERFVGRLLFRIDPLREATWDKALHHHRRAVAADPETVLSRRDLGETLADLGRDEEARTIWEAALALPSTFPVDDRFKDDIRRMLAELGEGEATVAAPATIPGARDR